MNPTARSAPTASQATLTLQHGASMLRFDGFEVAASHLVAVTAAANPHHPPSTRTLAPPPPPPSPSDRGRSRRRAPDSCRHPPPRLRHASSARPPCRRARERTCSCIFEGKRWLRPWLRRCTRARAGSDVRHAIALVQTCGGHAAGTGGARMSLGGGVGNAAACAGDAQHMRRPWLGHA